MSSAVLTIASAGTDKADGPTYKSAILRVP